MAEDTAPWAAPIAQLRGLLTPIESSLNSPRAGPCAVPLLRHHPPASRSPVLTSLRESERALETLFGALDVLRLETEQLQQRITTQRARFVHARIPVFALPDELLLQIFLYTLEKEDWQEDTLSAQAVTVSQVCRSWRQIAINHSVLWRTIVLPLPRTYLKLYQERCGDGAVHVTIADRLDLLCQPSDAAPGYMTSPTPYPLSNNRILVPFQQKIRGLTLLLREEDADLWFETWFDPAVPFLSLKSLSVVNMLGSGTGHVLDASRLIVPNLRFVRIHDLDLRLSPTVKATITHLGYYSLYRPLHFAHIIDGFAKLEALSFDGYFVTHPSPLSAVQLPALRYLQFGFHDAEDIIAMLSSIDAKGVVTLVFTDITWERNDGYPESEEGADEDEDEGETEEEGEDGSEDEAGIEEDDHGAGGEDSVNEDDQDVVAPDDQHRHSRTLGARLLHQPLPFPAVSELVINYPNTNTFNHMVDAIRLQSMVPFPALDRILVYDGPRPREGFVLDYLPFLDEYRRLGYSDVDIRFDCDHDSPFDDF